MGQRIHLTPTNDWVAHEKSDDCVCGPIEIFADGGVVFVHPSLDARERHEAYREKQRTLILEAKEQIAAASAEAGA